MTLDWIILDLLVAIPIALSLYGLVMCAYWIVRLTIIIEGLKEQKQ